jgi:hypothetical protein
MIYNLDNQEERNLYAMGNNKPSYPFKEGDDYYTIVGGDIVHSCWDDISEELYTPDRKYFSSEEEARKFMAKKFYTIRTYWQMCADTIVEAESLEEALEKVFEAPLPTDGEYLMGSFEIDKTNLEEGQYKEEFETIKDRF